MPLDAYDVTEHLHLLEKETKTEHSTLLGGDSYLSCAAFTRALRVRLSGKG